MHRLFRQPGIPGGLAKYKHGVDRWERGVPTEQERADIWTALHAMQGGRCAYCEGALVANKCHIEHFRQRARYPAGTFDWWNLFGSCNRKGTCGNHKDDCGTYPPANLIKPDVEDPELFLVFDAKGGVTARQGLSKADRLRAEETIRILNLDGALREIRFNELQGYIETAEHFAELAQEFPEEEWLPLFKEEIEKVMALPFATAILHVLTPQNAP